MFEGYFTVDRGKVGFLYDICYHCFKTGPPHPSPSLADASTRTVAALLGGEGGAASTQWAIIANLDNLPIWTPAMSPKFLLIHIPFVSAPGFPGIQNSSGRLIHRTRINYFFLGYLDKRRAKTVAPAQIQKTAGHRSFKLCLFMDH